MYKSEQKPKMPDNNVQNSFDTKENQDVPETFPTPPQASMCSPPMSIRGEDEDPPYSLMSQFSRNSSPVLFSPDEVRYI